MTPEPAVTTCRALAQAMNCEGTINEVIGIAYPSSGRR
jgi:hypothetical protein